MELASDIKLLIGTIAFENLEGGYWSLTDTDDNKKYLVSNIPDELKTEGIKIAAIAQEIDNEMSIYMVENIVKILNYRLLPNNDQ